MLFHGIDNMIANRELAEIEQWREYGGDMILAAGVIDVKSFYVEQPEDAALTERIASAVRTRIGLRPEVDPRPAGSLPRTELKARRVRDERPPSRR